LFRGYGNRQQLIKFNFESHRDKLSNALVASMRNGSNVPGSAFGIFLVPERMHWHQYQHQHQHQHHLAVKLRQPSPRARITLVPAFMSC